MQELQAISYIGPERAKEITELRPLFNIEELQDVDGIGPKRLEEIKQHAVLKT